LQDGSRKGLRRPKDFVLARAGDFFYNRSMAQDRWKEILVFVAGTTPQIITETIYASARKVRNETSFKRDYDNGLHQHPSIFGSSGRWVLPEMEPVNPFLFVTN
jgi:hypothetical protein